MTEQSLANQDNAPLERINEAKASLAPLTDDLEHLHRLATMGTLTAGVAHEINNLLTPVLGYAQLAMAHPDDAQLVEKALTKAVAGVKAATRIAEIILGFTSDNDITQEYADIGRVVQASLECLARKPDKSGIQIIIQVPPGLMAKIPPLSLQNVLINLIINACHALDANAGGTVTISATSGSKGMILIRVQDTGPGISKEIADRLFEPFVSSKKEAVLSFKPQEKQGGFGLGLAICKHLIESANGSIAVHSASGSGTTFTITLPVHLEAQAKAG